MLVGVISYIKIHRGFFYIIIYISVIKKCTYKINSILLISQIFGLSSYLNREYRKWTIKQKIMWHFSQSIYFYIASNIYYI